MILGNNSKLMLKYQKAKAKLVEYKIPTNEYPHFALNSNELSYPATYILSRYSECVIDNEEEELLKFEPLLILVAQYYDAALNSKDRKFHDFDFLLSGAAAYFLTGDFGSSKVLSKRAKNHINKQERTPQRLILNVFDYVLHGKFVSYMKITDTFSKINNAFLDCFGKGMSHENLTSNLLEFRKEIYDEDDPDNIFYVDILIAIILRALENLSWTILPEASDLTVDEWRTYLEKRTAIKILWPAQRLIAEKGIMKGENAIIQLPTGVGKTKSIELIIRAAFLSGRANTVIIVAPLRALCNEITLDMSHAFGTEATVNQFSDVLQNDFLDLFEGIIEKQILVCTPEKLNYVLHHQPDFLEYIDAFIFDEGHMFDDGSRGVAYELLITHIRESLSEEQQLVLLSAVLPNSDAISSWLFQGKGVLATDAKIISTPKSVGFSSAGGDIFFYTDDNSNEDFYIPRVLKVLELKKKKNERRTRCFPDVTSSIDIALYNAIKLCPNGGVAIYMGQQRSIKTVLKRVIELKERGLDLSAIKDGINNDECEKLKKFIAEYYGDNHYFTVACNMGILPHSSNIPNGIKIAVENALKKGDISCVVCTSTLAQGVNIPIKYLLVTSIRTGQDIIKTRNFQNLIGRTARAGIYTEGSIIITDPKIYDQRLTPRGQYTWADCIRLFDPKSAEPCSSSILSLVQNHTIDYEYTFSGKGFITYIIDHYDDQDPFMDCIEIIKNDYLSKYPAKSNNSIYTEVMLCKSVFSSIENYLTLVFANGNINQYDDVALNICRNTLAYTLASDEERSLLEQVFLKLSQTLQKFEVDQLKKYSYAMSSIEQSSQIEQWILETKLMETSLSENDLLEMVMELYRKLFDKSKCTEEFDDICKLWIEGKTPYYMSIATGCDISEVDDICNKKISYELNFFIGNICDLIIVDDEELQVDHRENLTILQKKVKYGVPSLTAISICEQLFNDRILSLKIANILSDDNIDGDRIVRAIEFCEDDILNLLSDYPQYFTDRLKSLLA